GGEAGGGDARGAPLVERAPDALPSGADDYRRAAERQGADAGGGGAAEAGAGEGPVVAAVAAAEHRGRGGGVDEVGVGGVDVEPVDGLAVGAERRPGADGSGGRRGERQGAGEQKDGGECAAGGTVERSHHKEMRPSVCLDARRFVPLQTGTACSCLNCTTVRTGRIGAP